MCTVRNTSLEPETTQDESNVTPTGFKFPVKPQEQDPTTLESTTKVSITDDNSCIEGAIIGGIPGGGGGVLATQENWIWSIPTGIMVVLNWLSS